MPARALPVTTSQPSAALIKAISSVHRGEIRLGGPQATHDFVPSKNAPVYLTEKKIVGELAPGDFHGIRARLLRRKLASPNA